MIPKSLKKRTIRLVKSAEQVSLPRLPHAWHGLDGLDQPLVTSVTKQRPTWQAQPGERRRASHSLSPNDFHRFLVLPSPRMLPENFIRCLPSWNNSHHYEMLCYKNWCVPYHDHVKIGMVAMTNTDIPLLIKPWRAITVRLIYPNMNPFGCLKCISQGFSKGKLMLRGATSINMVKDIHYYPATTNNNVPNVKNNNALTNDLKPHIKHWLSLMWYW